MICCRTLRLKDGLPSSCFGCGLPVCGGGCNAKKASGCEGLKDSAEEDATPYHVKSGECALIAAAAAAGSKDAKDAKLGNLVSHWLAVLRALTLKRSAPEDYQRFMELEHHVEDIRESVVIQSYKQKVVGPLQALLGQDWSEGEIIRCCGRLDSNAFRIDTGHRGGLRAVYATASKINHDCGPNSRVSFDSDKRLHLFAKTYINRGEEITVTYCNPLLGTPARQKKLLSTRFISCKCKRCNDPTEYGTSLYKQGPDLVVIG